MLLSELSHPNQLHGLTVSQLEEIACQIRERHLQVVSTSGGHLGPGLGVVELTSFCSLENFPLIGIVLVMSPL